MDEYITTEVIELTGGVLELSEDQSRRRKHKLKALGNGLFEIMETVQFKAGEVFKFDGQIGKGLANKMEKAEDLKPKKQKAKSEE